MGLWQVLCDLRSDLSVGQKVEMPAPAVDAGDVRCVRGSATLPALSTRSPELQLRTKSPGKEEVREPMTGIEPALSAWEAEVLPLNYIGVRRDAIDSLADQALYGSTVLVRVEP